MAPSCLGSLYACHAISYDMLHQQGLSSRAPHEHYSLAVDPITVMKRGSAKTECDPLF